MNSHAQPYLSIVIPAYNEQGRLPATLNDIHRYLLAQSYQFEIIIVDDGSADHTSASARDLKLPGVVVHRYEENRGKGFAINYGFERAHGQYILMCDADNATPFYQISKLLEFTPEYKVIIGSRYFENSRANEQRSWARIMVAKLSNLFAQVLILPGVPDTQCGFKLFEATAARRIFAHQTIWGWAFDMEILLIAKKMGYQIKTVPVEWNNAAGSKIQSPLVFLTTFGELLKIKFRSMIKRYQ